MSQTTLPSDRLITTPLTNLLQIPHPILLAGMAHTSTAPLAAAVSNAGGLGTIGGLGYTPQHLRTMIQELKFLLHQHHHHHKANKNDSNGTGNNIGGALPLPFGVDLALPAVGGTARKTNHDYTNGLLEELIDVIIEEGTTLFVSAVGVPPRRIVERLHEGGVVVMNMVGHPRHAVKAFEAGVDIVCAQGGEGGGHTGEIPMGVLVPACVDVAKGYEPVMCRGLVRRETKTTGQQRGDGKGMVVAAGGVYDGRGLAGALALGAVGVWVGTRFVASEEAGCSRLHKEAVVDAGWADTVKTLVVSGRPLRVKRNEYIQQWETREGEVKRLTEKGVVPMERDIEEEKDVDLPYLMGQVAAVIGDVKPAKQIVEEMVSEAVECLDTGYGYLGKGGSKGKGTSKL